jgi:hypothetical protein
MSRGVAAALVQEGSCLKCQGVLKAWTRDSFFRREGCGGWCSWCFERATHFIFEKRVISRHKFACEVCARMTVPCRLCARGGGGGDVAFARAYDDWGKGASAALT